MQTQSHINSPNNPAPRFSQSENVARGVSMSSLELVDFINSKRDKSEPTLTHKNLIAKVPRVLGADQSAKFSADYLDTRSRIQKCFVFPKREACLIAMSYSYELQALVFDRMTALEDRERARSLPSNPKIVGELAILECFDRLLNAMYAAEPSLDDRESAEEAVFNLACSRVERMTSSKRDRAEYVAKGVFRRYRYMHQGGQSSNPDPLIKPEMFRAWLKSEYGVNLISDRWGRDWEPFVQLCFDACYDIDAQALSPIGGVIYKMKEAA